MSVSTQFCLTTDYLPSYLILSNCPDPPTLQTSKSQSAPAIAKDARSFSTGFTAGIKSSLGTESGFGAALSLLFVGVSCLQVQGLDYLLDQRPWGRVEGLGSHGIINCHQHPLKIYKHLTSTYTLDVHILDWTPFQKLPGMNDLETGVPGIEVATETLNPNTQTYGFRVA